MTPIRYYSGQITELQPNQVFTFGANKSGFHGAGSAGFASFNRAGNHWREFGYGEKPRGWKGCWNEKGRVGPQTGTKGRSYALVTVTNAGAKRSISPEQMKLNISELYRHASANPTDTFLVAQSSQTGLNGYTGAEMADCFADAATIPANIVFAQDFATLVAARTGRPMIAMENIHDAKAAATGLDRSTAKNTNLGKAYPPENNPMGDEFLVVIPVGETPIAPGSGICAQADRGMVRIDFEGNIHGAQNMNLWEEKVYHAASRGHTRYPTIARIFLSAEEFQSKLLVVGETSITAMQNTLRDRMSPIPANERLRACIHILTGQENPLKQWLTSS